MIRSEKLRFAHKEYMAIQESINLNTRNIVRWLLAMTLILLGGIPLFSQANQGTIQGSVFDQTGGAISRAAVTVIDVARGVSRPLTTDSAGAYVAPNLIPGTYTVRAVATGFQTLEHSNVMVEVGQTVRVDLVLQPGQQTQTVTVTSEAPAVDTTDVTLGGTISQQTLVSLPMNGRDFKNLMELRPGVTAYQGGGIDTWSSNGTRAEDVGYLIDGLRADEAYTGNSVVNSPMPQGDAATGLPLDAIQEMNTEENPKAEFGWKPGAIVNVGVKSGTNGLHGSGFAFGRETSFDARNYFDVAPNPKQPVQLEQFGGSAGGPIKKDKVFWFADYEGQRYSVGSTGTTTTPATTLLPGGATKTNVTASLVNACLDLNAKNIKITPLSAQLAGLNPTTCQVAPTNYTPGPTEALFPTLPGNTGQQGILLGLLNVARQDNGIAKIDYRINDHNSINGMYFIGEGGIVAAGLYGVPGTANAPWDGSYGAKAQLWSGAWNWTPSSTRVNEFRVGYDRFNQLYDSVDANVNPLAYGLNTGQTNPFLFGFPTIKITGFANTGSSLAKLIGPDGSLQILDHYTLVHGNQTYKIGGEFINNTVNGDTVQNGKGVVAFSNLEAFLQGSVKSGGNRIFAGNPQRHITQNQYALFGEDDWRATRKVMLNLGLRWEYNSVIKESNNLLGEFDPSMGLVQVGKQIGSPYNGDFRDFSPRVGVAWDMRGNGRTVLRAGGSLMYSALPIISFVATAQSLGLTLTPTGNSIYTAANPGGVPGSGNIQVAAVSPPGSVLTPGWQAQSAACVSGGTTACGSIFPQSAFQFQCGDSSVTGLGGAPIGPCLAEAVDRNLKTPYTGTWTAGIQQAITNDLSLDVSYVGTHGGNQSGFLDINEAALGSGFTAAQIAAGDPSVASVTAEQKARPYYKQFSYLSYIDELGNFYRSNYAGLQVTLTQRTSHGLSFLAGYSYSHALDNASTVQLAQIPVDSNLPGFQYGNSDFDTRHRLTLTMSYAIPGKKSPAQLLEGWAVNSVVTLQSGQPWSPRDLTNDLSGTGEVTNLDPYGQAWNVSGPDSAFTSTSQNLPCWSGTGGAALPSCKLAGSSPTTAPAPCLAAAAAISANTIAATNSVGCYVSTNGKSVLFPAALGTIGDTGRNIFRDSGFRNWDFSVTKDWKFKERLDAQFRAEIFNILNHPNFSNPGGIGTGAGYNDPSIGEPTGGGFGCGCVTPDQASPNPVLGAGGSRAMQLGLKLSF